VAAIPAGIHPDEKPNKDSLSSKKIKKVSKIVSENCLGERRNCQMSFYCNFREYKYSYQAGWIKHGRDFLMEQMGSLLLFGLPHLARGFGILFFH
jgi:hypothetical protein